MSQLALPLLLIALIEAKLFWEHSNKKLVTPPIAIISVSHPAKCISHCIIHTNCASANLLPSNGTSQQCELLDTDQTNKNLELVDAQQTSHYDQMNCQKCKPYRSPCFADSYTCNCNDQLNGEASCQSWYNMGFRVNGRYQINKKSSSYCEMNRHDGVWMVIQRRCDGSYPELHKNGNFKGIQGKLMHEFFRGTNIIVNFMEGSKQTKLLVEAEDEDGQQYIAKYSHFYITTANTRKYFQASGYHGNLGNLFDDGSESNTEMKCNIGGSASDIIKCSIFRLNTKWDNGVKWVLPDGREVLLVKTRIMIQIIFDSSANSAGAVGV